MRRNYFWVVGFAALVSVGLFIGGIVVTSDWSSLWGGHITTEDPWNMMEDHWEDEEWEEWHVDMHDHMEDHWEDEEWEEWHVDMHDHMEDHWGEDECHEEVAEWHHMHDHGDEDECHE